MSETPGLAEADIEDLPPTQALILELLAARARCGEEMWTLARRTAPARVLEALDATGLIGWKGGIVEGTNLAWLTDLGRRVMLSTSYTPPALLPIAELQAENEHLRAALRAVARGDDT